MHSTTNSAASGTGARRISRWHPYHSAVAVTPSASSSSTSESGGTHASLFAPRRCTLSSSLYAPSPVSIRAEHPVEPTSASPSADAAASNQITHPTLATTADRATYARCIVDRAVKTLTEKWLPVAYGAFPPVALALTRDPEVIAPNGATAQSSTSSFCLAAPDFVTPTCGGSQLARYPYQSTAEHMPLKQFMHEVLRRSRTSCTSLQIALCYVEAVAAKLPDLVEEEMCRIARLASGETHDENASAFPDIPIESALGLEGSNGDTASEVPVALPPLPSLPSPLLCPRRTFLASVLLASKFLQDRSYSNKAWGKLTGLAPREVGRCERALSAALEWRLWVGKGQDSPFPVDFMDDGGPVIPTDSPFTPDSATTDSPVALVQPQSIPAEVPPRDNRLRKTKSEALVRCGRASRRVGASASWTAPSPSMASASSACSFAAGPSRPPRARTAPWTGEVISPSSMVAGSQTPYLKTPLLDALPTQLLRDPTLADWASVSSSSLSPPGSLIHTQSSVASIASFPELSTPPDMFTVPHGNALKWTAGQCNARDGFFGIGDGVPTIDIVGSDWY